MELPTVIGIRIHDDVLFVDSPVLNKFVSSTHISFRRLTLLVGTLSDSEEQDTDEVSLPQLTTCIVGEYRQN